MKFLCPESIDGGPAYTHANCTRLLAVASYTVGMSYSTLIAGSNIIAAVPMTPADFSFTDGALGSRVSNNAAKTDSAADANGDPTHFVFVNDAATKILRVTDENTANSVAAGGAVSLPNLPLIGRQPIAA